MKTVGRHKRAADPGRSVAALTFLDTRDFPTSMEDVLRRFPVAGMADAARRFEEPKGVNEENAFPPGGKRGAEASRHSIRHARTKPRRRKRKLAGGDGVDQRDGGDKEEGQIFIKVFKEDSMNCKWHFSIYSKGKNVSRLNATSVSILDHPNFAPFRARPRPTNPTLETGSERDLRPNTPDGGGHLGADESPSSGGRAAPPPKTPADRPRAPKVSEPPGKDEVAPSTGAYLGGATPSSPGAHPPQATAAPMPKMAPGKVTKEVGSLSRLWGTFNGEETPLLSTRGHQKVSGNNDSANINKPLHSSKQIVQVTNRKLEAGKEYR